MKSINSNNPFVEGKQGIEYEELFVLIVEHVFIAIFAVLRLFLTTMLS